MRGATPPLPQYIFMAWCLVKHRDNFTFYFYLYLSQVNDISYELSLIYKFYLTKFKKLKNRQILAVHPLEREA
jgi:hypothetical protein